MYYVDNKYLGRLFIDNNNRILASLAILDLK